jgi:hypothetical protein
LPYHPSLRFPHRKLKSRPSALKLKLRLMPARRQQARHVSRRAALQATRTPHRQPLPCLPAAWLCPKPGLARSIRRPIQLHPHPPQALEIRPPAFNAASRSSTAGPLEALALIPNALREALQDSIRPERARVPSILPALHREATPDQVVLPLLAPAPVMARGPALERPVPADSAARHVLAALRPPARRLVRSERRPAEAEVDARSTPRPKKAR